MCDTREVIYHYCSLDTFLNIVKNRTIRLSEIGKSNDYMETKWLLNYFEEEVIRQYNMHPFIESGGLISGLDDIDTLRFLIKNETHKLINKNDQLFYAACFSEKGDKLSQWRAYADDAKGISIGFNSYILKDIANIDELMKLKKIIYPNEQVPNEISEFSKSFLVNIYSALQNRDVNGIFHNDYSSSLFIMLSSSLLFQNSIFFKNPAFEEEEEWRLVLDDELTKDGTDWGDWYDREAEEPLVYESFGKCFPKGLQFKCSNDNLISFLDLSFKGFEDNLISNIFIGPKSKVDEDDLYQLLSYYGYQQEKEIKIEKSKSTYR